MSRTFVVVGLGYGDEGKGSVVDYLVRKTGAQTVVRFNGGPQAAHNVVLPNGTHHTFSTWGSGTLAGARTVLGPEVLINPLNAFNEARHLEEIGVHEPFSLLHVDPRCRVITPWHVMRNRVEEDARGEGRYGSCGEGIGALMEDAVEDRACLLAFVVINFPERVSKILWEIRDQVIALTEAAVGTSAREAFEGIDVRETAARYAEFGRLAKTFRNPYSLWLGPDLRHRPLVFEGAQGVLIDQTHGLGAPEHATWSDCTPANALQMLADSHYPGTHAVLGVTRTYMVRHGPGPLPGESDVSGDQPDEHNQTNAWQGPVRYAPPDFPNLRRAIEACGGVSGIALTHLDAADSSSKTSTAYLFESQLRVPVILRSWGPTHQDKNFSETATAVSPTSSRDHITHSSENRAQT